MESLVMYGGLSADLSEGDFVTGGTKNYLAPTAPTSEWYRFTIKVRRGEKFETESVSGTCVGPDGLVVIPIAANQLEPHTPIVNYGGPEVTVQIVGSDDRHGLTLLKLSGRLREWIKCNKTLPKLDQDLRIFRGTVSVNCLASAIGLAYPPPLEGNDAFQIRQYPGAQPLKRGDKVVSEENELLGLVLEPINDPDGDKSHQRGLVVPAVHIQKLVDNYRSKSLSN